jgi:hypothetical protein
LPKLGKPPFPEVDLLEDEGVGFIVMGSKPSRSDSDDDEIFVVGDGTDELLERSGRPFGFSDELLDSAELLDSVPWAIWFGSSAVPAILSEQAERLSAEKAATLIVKNLLNNLVIAVLLSLFGERE